MYTMYFQVPFTCGYFFEETSGKAMDNIRSNASDRVEKGFKK